MAIRYFELVDDKSNKFWQVERNELTMIVSYGKIGTDGTQQQKEFESNETIEQAINKLISDKTKKGYIEIIALAHPESSTSGEPCTTLLSAPINCNLIAEVSDGNIQPKIREQIEIPSPSKQRDDISIAPWFKRIEDMVIGKTKKFKVLPTRKNPADRRKPSLITSFNRIIKLLMIKDIYSDGRYIIDTKTPSEYRTVLENTLLRIKDANVEGDIESDAILYVLVAFVPVYNNLKDNNDCIVDFLIAKGGLSYTIDVFLKAQTYQISFTDKSKIMLSNEVSKPLSSNYGMQYSMAELSLANWLSNSDEDIFAICKSKLKNAVDALHFSRKPLIALLLPDDTRFANQIAHELVSQGHKNKYTTVWLSLVATDEAYIEQIEENNLLGSNHNVDIQMLIVGMWFKNLGAAKAIDMIVNQPYYISVDLAKIILAIGHPKGFKVIAKRSENKKSLRMLLSETLVSNPLAAYVGFAELSLEEKVSDFITKMLDNILLSQADNIPLIYPWVSDEIKEFTQSALKKQQNNKSTINDSIFAEQSELPQLLISPPWLLKKNKPTSVILVNPLELEEKIIDLNAKQVIDYLNDDKNKARIEGNKTIYGILKNAGLRVNAVVEKHPNNIVKLVANAIENNEIDEMVKALKHYSHNWEMDLNLAFTVYLPDESVLAMVEHCPHLIFHKLDYLLYRFGTDAIKAIIAYAKYKPTHTVDIWPYIASSELAPIVANVYNSKKKYKKAALDWCLKFPEYCIVGLIPAALGKKNEAQKHAHTLLRQLNQNGHEQLILDVTARYNNKKIQDRIITILNEDPLDLFPKKLGVLPPFWRPEVWHRPRLKGTNKVLDDQAIAYIGTMLQFPTTEGIYEGINIIKNEFDPNSLADFAWDIFQEWDMAAGPAKDNWAFKALGILGNDDSARKLIPLIRQWPGESLHQRSVLGLEILEMIGSDVALMLLNGIAQKSKFKGLQDKAKEKIAEIADKRNLSIDELEDRLAPTLGLDENGELILDFGPRQFKVSFDETLRPFVRDCDGVRLKDLPKPKQSDDKEKSTEAVNRFKALKKDAKMIASQEIFRLEKAMCLQRRWDSVLFITLLVNHPVLRHLVDKLIWGVYQLNNDSAFGGKLINCFRVAEDGTFTNSQDEQFELPRGGDYKIGIPHVLALTEQERNAFVQLFSDYEIIQPFKQLDRDVYYLTKEEMNSKKLIRFSNDMIPIGKILGLKYKGWVPGEVWDAGVLYHYFKPISQNRFIKISLEEGVYLSDITYSPDQKIESIAISTTADYFLNEENALEFSVLDKIEASEFMRDMMYLIGK